jgi:hypothetical protein
MQLICICAFFIPSKEYLYKNPMLLREFIKATIIEYLTQQEVL